MACGGGWVVGGAGAPHAAPGGPRVGLGHRFAAAWVRVRGRRLGTRVVVCLSARRPIEFGRPRLRRPCVSLCTVCLSVCLWLTRGLRGLTVCDL